MRRGIDQPHFVQDPAAAQQRLPGEIDHGIGEAEHRAAFRGLERKFAQLQPERERVETDLANAGPVMQLFRGEARQLAPGNPRREQEAD